MPDKAVSLLDTACARVAISQTAKPAAIEDAEVAIAALESERQALAKESDLSDAQAEKIAEIEEKLGQGQGAAGGAAGGLGRASSDLVKEILELREQDRRGEGRDGRDATAALREQGGGARRDRRPRRA